MKCDLIIIIKFFCPPSAVSKMPHEGSAHRPVEMLPFLRARNKRKAAQLQVCDFCDIAFLNNKVYILAKA